jgi:hypothetical protein
MHSSFTQGKSRLNSSATFSVGIGFFLSLCALSSVQLAFTQSALEQPSALAQVRPIHVVRWVDPRTKIDLQAPQAAAHLDYYGGPVVSNVQVIVVLWGTGVSSVVTREIGDFFRDITKSTYFDMLSQYSMTITPVGGGTGTNQSIGRGSYAGAFMITPSVCATAPCTVDDSQIQTEILNQITAGICLHPPSTTTGMSIHFI